MNPIRLFLLDIIFPNFCPICGNFIKWDRFCCAECYQKLEFTGSEICSGCGKRHCICDEVSYDYAYTACYYCENAINCILTMKKSQGSNAAVIFGNILADKILNSPHRFDMIIPVPMAYLKAEERGYNQAEMVSRIIGKRLGIPVNNKILGRDMSFIEQHKLSAKERASTLKYYYIKKYENLEGIRVLLCDDVLTTGNTVCRCAELLRELGAEFIAVACCTTVAKSYKDEIPEEEIDMPEEAEGEI